MEVGNKEGKRSATTDWGESKFWLENWPSIWRQAKCEGGPTDHSVSKVTFRECTVFGSCSVRVMQNVTTVRSYQLKKMTTTGSLVSALKLNQHPHTRHELPFDQSGIRC